MTTVTTEATAQECSPPPRTGGATRAARGYAAGKDDYLLRLHRIEGQIRGLQKMIEDDRWCPDVVTQVAAVIRALQEVAVGLLNDHLRHCGQDLRHRRRAAAGRGRRLDPSSLAAMTRTHTGGRVAVTPGRAPRKESR